MSAGGKEGSADRPTASASTVVLTVHHATTYTYSSPVGNAQHLAVVTPQAFPWQAVLHHDVSIDPAPSYRHTRVDAFGNHVMHFTLDVPHDSLALSSTSTVALTQRWADLEPADSEPWEALAQRLQFRAGAPFLPESEFAFASPNITLTRALRDYATRSFAADVPVLVGALDLMHRIHADFKYEAASTEVHTPADVAFAQRRGVCQDFAQIMIGCLRALGLSARYVSGYLRTDPPPGQPKLIGADASHAWVSVFCPQLGWVDLDPTNDVLADTGHVTLALGRDYSDVSLLRGVLVGGGAHEVDVAVSVVQT